MTIVAHILPKQISEAQATVNRMGLSEKIALKFPDDARAQVLGASALRIKGDEVAALAMVQRASLLQPQNNWVKQTVLSELTHLQAWLEAEKYLANGPQDENTWLMRGRLLLEARQRDATESFYNSLVQQQKQPSQKLQLSSDNWQTLTVAGPTLNAGIAASIRARNASVRSCDYLSCW